MNIRMLAPWTAALSLSVCFVLPAHAADTDGDGVPDDQEVAFGLDPNVRDNDVFGSATLFARQQYRDMLGREIDPSGESYWVNNIRAGSQSRSSMIESIALLSEYRDVVGPVFRLYSAYFLRKPDESGWTFWPQQYRSGAWTFIGISDFFAGSPEFKQRYGTLNNGQFVDLIYQNVLGRAPDPGGRAFWVDELNSGRRTRGQVMADFSESPENKSKTDADVKVFSLYWSMLGRFADPSGFDFWTAQLRAGQPYANLVNALINTAEYKSRFLGASFAAKETDIIAKAARLANSATFGATETDVTLIREFGPVAFVDSQFGKATSTYPNYILLDFDNTKRPPTCQNDPNNPASAASQCARLSSSGLGAQMVFYQQALSGDDQLRQRVAWALSQILVTSGVEDSRTNGIRNYQQMLRDNAFGNFKELLRQVTLSPYMGRFLDMVNNQKAYNVGTAPNVVTVQPNENFARELLQLFALGVWELNQDGTYKNNPANPGNPIATYDQDNVLNYTRALTGWTYAPLPGAPTTNSTNPTNYDAFMVPDPRSPLTSNRHDSAAKTLLPASACVAGVSKATLPAGQSAAQDFEDTITNVFCHPNVAPFIGRQLIQFLVTSNPSPAYVGRVSAVFNNNGLNVRGDMKAVIRAILLDPEARWSNATAFGRLKEPVLLMTGLFRALPGSASDGLYLQQQSGGLSQNTFFAPTVFNYYPAEYVVPGTDLDGPQFGIFTATASFSRANFVYNITFNNTNNGNPDANLTGSIGSKLNMTPYVALASNPAALVDRLGQLLTPGRLATDQRQAIIDAVTATSATAGTPAGMDRVRTAIYLFAASPLFQVDR